MQNPTCCGQETKFVNNGRNLQYFFCAECKKEVEHPDPLLYVQSLSDEDADEFFKRLQQTNLIDPPMDMQEQLRQSLVVESDLTFGNINELLKHGRDTINQPPFSHGSVIDAISYANGPNKVWISQINPPEEFPETIVSHIKRGMIFDLPRQEVTISQLIKMLQTLPPSAVLREVQTRFDMDIMQFKIHHESFLAMPENGLYPRENLWDYESEYKGIPGDEL